MFFVAEPSSCFSVFVLLQLGHIQCEVGGRYLVRNEFSCNGEWEERWLSTRPRYAKHADSLVEVMPPTRTESFAVLCPSPVVRIHKAVEPGRCHGGCLGNCRLRRHLKGDVGAAAIFHGPRRWVPIQGS